METVVLDGVKYVKASVLAKQFSYTSDYLGQLCRAKKIDARLVGRTWFVNPDSVTEHRRKKKQRSSQKKGVESEPVLPRESKPKRKVVLPVVQNRTVKATNDLAVKIAGVETRKLSVAYEKDEGNLLPTITKKKVGPAKTIRIEQVNAKKIKIAGDKKTKTTFKAGELPEVSLSGKLNITTVTETEPEPDPEPQPEEPVNDAKTSFENRLISAEQDSSKKINVVKKATTEEQKVVKKAKKLAKTTNKKLTLTNIDQEKAKPVIKTDLSSSTEPSSDQPILSPVQPEAKTSGVLLASPLIATVLALVCVLLIFSASSKVVVFGSEFESKIILQMANLLEIFNQ